LKRAALAAFPEGTVWEFYGSTEGQFTACPPADWLERPGTVGRARPGRRLSTDPDGTVWCEVPDFARFTYWRDPDKTAAAWRGEAFTVGDLGRLDPDGYLWLEGRREDLLISGGVNIYPLEVERALAACPGVDEVAVFGVPDEPLWSARSRPTPSTPSPATGWPRPSGPRRSSSCRPCPAPTGARCAVPRWPANWDSVPDCG
jgi:acyl-CoA synthetase (AMP-forming)/AMP-acid ligase II